MTILQFADTHNLVAFLTKSAESEEFEQIVDFFECKFDKAKTVNEEVQLQALVDGKKIVVTEASVRRDLQLEDANGVDFLPNAIIFEQLTLIGAKTTEWNEFSSTMASTIICLANNQKFNFSKYIFKSMVKNLDSAVKFLMYLRFVQVFLDNSTEGMINHNRIYIAPSHTKKVFANMKRQGKDFSGRITPLFSTMMVQAQQEQGEDEAVNEENVSKHFNDPLLSGKDRLKLEELMALCTNLQNRVLDLEHTQTTQALEINSLKRKVKKLEKKQRSRTHGLRRLYKGRKIHDIDADKDITLENVHDEDMFDTCVFNDEEVFAGQDMAEKEVSTVDPVTTAGEVVTTANVEVSTASPIAATITTVELTLAQTLVELKSARPKTKGVVMQEPSETTTTTTTIPSKDKGKGIMVEEPLKMKKKDQVKTDYELAQRLQAEEQEELTIEEKSKQFQQLLEKRRKHFAAKRAEERRNRPPTKAQQRSIMCTYLKNMAGWKPKDLKTKSFANVQELFNKAMKRVNTFVDMDTKLVGGSEVRAEDSKTKEESSSKRTGEELKSYKSKKKKLDEKVEAEVDDAKEAEELKQCLEIVPDDGDDVTINATPLSVKIPIVDYKIYQEGKKSFFKIIRADGKTQIFKKTEPVNYMDIFLHLNLKTMFEHHVEDSIWKNQQGLVKVLNWKLFYSCGVHCVTVQSIPYYLLVKKMYPLTKNTLHQMFNNVKLQVDYECEMAYELLRLVKKPLKEGYVPE
ncbi:hypothetical protein Tco_0626176 [Tanacetum coccineum]|uniref:Synaptobrevin, longin-like domain protein n=1 Tax=Tanacetum coccineum TaxID=301880 RepID=A0ABQ4WJ03_9ASTR